MSHPQAERAALPGEVRWRGRSSEESFGGSDVCNELFSDLLKCKDDCTSLYRNNNNANCEDLFLHCVFKVLEDEQLCYDDKFAATTANKKWQWCSIAFKVFWICLLLALGFGLVAVGFKPVAFAVHKVLHYIVWHYCAL